MAGQPETALHKEEAEQASPRQEQLCHLGFYGDMAWLI
jgi:hypothetical protein